MSTGKKKHLSRLVGLYLAGAVICSGMMAYDMMAAEAATKFEQDIAAKLADASFATGKVSIELQEVRDADGNVAYKAVLTNGSGVQGEVVSGTNPANKNVDITNLGLDSFAGSELSIDTKNVEGIQISGDTGTVNKPLTVAGAKPIEVAGDMTLNASSVDMSGASLEVTSGTLKVENQGASVSVGDVTVKGGTVETSDQTALKAGNLTVESGTVNAAVQATGAVTVAGGTVTKAITGETVTVNDGTVSGAITGKNSVAVTGGAVSGNISSDAKVEISGGATINAGASISGKDVAVTGGTVNGNIETAAGGTVTLTGGTVKGEVKADAVTFDGATVDTGAKITTNKVTVGAGNTANVEEIKITAEAGKKVEINGLSAADAEKVLGNLTTVDQNGNITGEKVEVTIKDDTGKEYTSSVTTTTDPTQKPQVTPPQVVAKTTMDKLNDALKDAEGAVGIKLQTDASGKTTILVTKNGVEGEVATTGSTSKVVNLADLALPAGVTGLTVDTGNVADAIEISGGSVAVPVELTGNTAAKLTIGDGVTAENLTISNTAGVTVTTGDNVALGELTVSEGASVTAADATKAVTADKVNIAKDAALNGTVTTSEVTVAAGAKTDNLKLNPVGGNLVVNAPDKATAEKLIQKNVTLADGDKITVVDDRGTTTYEPELNPDGSIKDLGQGETVAATPEQQINKYLSDKGLSVGDPFANKLPSQSDMDAIAKTLDLTQAADVQAYQQLHSNVVNAAKQGAAPAVGAMQAATAVANVAIGNVADRLDQRRSEQQGYMIQNTGDVKGAYAGRESNLWAAIKHGKTDIDNSEYGQSSVDYTYYQLGYDHQVADDAYIGAYIGGTTGDVETNGMSTDIDKAYDIGLYGTKLLPEGQYLNLLGRYGKMTNKYRTMDWDTTSYGLTVEYGQKLQQPGGFTVTPFVQLNYGHVSGDDALVGLNNLSMDDAKNLSTRFGARFEDADDKGNSVYGGLSYLWGMSGEYKMYMNGISLPEVKNDLGVLAINIGFKRQMSESSYFNLTLEKEMIDYDGWNVQGALNFAF